jgi:hypothetical protein
MQTSNARPEVEAVLSIASAILDHTPAWQRLGDEERRAVGQHLAGMMERSLALRAVSLRNDDEPVCDFQPFRADVPGS